MTADFDSHEMLLGAIARKIREAREDQNISQTELAKRLKWAASAVSRLESGNRDPRVSTVIAIARELGLTPNDLLPY